MINLKFTRFGYAIEATEQIIKYAFEELSFTYLLAATDADHLISQKVALRAGLQFYEEKYVEGRLTRYYRVENIKDIDGN
jgi:RimJ/RimL family protein N-acetyltransferase